MVLTLTLLMPMGWGPYSYFLRTHKRPRNENIEGSGERDRQSVAQVTQVPFDKGGETRLAAERKVQCSQTRWRMMRHSSITTTANYGDTVASDLRQAHEKVVQWALQHGNGTEGSTTHWNIGVGDGNWKRPKTWIQQLAERRDAL